MPKVSMVPGSPQSSTSTVNGSVVVPVDRITDAVPVNLACLLPGVAGHAMPGLLMKRPSIVLALIRTSCAWSLYSRFPLGAQHFTENPNVAFEVDPLALGTSAGTESRSPVAEKSGSPPIWPPPVTLPGVDGTPPRQSPPGAGAVSQGVKSAS